MHPNPNPNPNSIPPAPDPVYSSHYAYYSQNPPLSIPFPHVYPDPSPAELKPPGVDSYPPASSVPQVTQPPAVSYVQEYPASSNYYGAYPTGYVGSASVPVAQEGLQQLAVVQPTTLWTNYVYQPQGNKNPYKREKRKKKTKVVQSAYCEVCKVDCNSKDVLETHKSGKKHKKILERVSVAHEGLQQQVAVAQPTSTLANNVDQLQGNENPNNCQKEIKAVPSAYCEVCKVDCKSKEVLDQHKLGKKHKKRLESVSVGQEGLQQQLAVLQPASTLDNYGYEPQGDESSNKSHEKEKSVSVAQEGLEQQLEVAQPASTLDNYGYEPQGNKVSNKSQEEAKSVLVAQEGLQHQLAVAQPTSTLDNYGYDAQGNESSNKSQDKAKVVPSTYCDVWN